MEFCTFALTLFTNLNSNATFDKEAPPKYKVWGEIPGSSRIQMAHQLNHSTSTGTSHDAVRLLVPEGPCLWNQKSYGYVGGAVGKLMVDLVGMELHLETQDLAIQHYSSLFR